MGSHSPCAPGHERAGEAYPVSHESPRPTGPPVGLFVGATSYMALTLRPDLADEHGLVAVGGDLRPGTLLRAYRSGVFPWYNEDEPILWWSPDPRAIFELECFSLSRRLARTIRAGKFRLTINHAFAEVI